MEVIYFKKIRQKIMTDIKNIILKRKSQKIKEYMSSKICLFYFFLIYFYYLKNYIMLIHK